MIKVGVLGAKGRMGSQVCQTVAAAEDLEVTAEVDAGDQRDALTGCDVVVDFTHPGAVLDNLHWCVGNGLDAIVGTSGFDEPKLAQVRDFRRLARDQNAARLDSVVELSHHLGERVKNIVVQHVALGRVVQRQPRDGLGRGCVLAGYWPTVAVGVGVAFGPFLQSVVL